MFIWCRLVVGCCHMNITDVTFISSTLINNRQVKHPHWGGKNSWTLLVMGIAIQQISP